VTIRNWKILKFVAGVGTGVVALHGAKTRQWRRWHTVFVVAGSVATIGAALTEWRTDTNSQNVGEERTAKTPSAVA
jgi:hypothetical protein